MSFAMPRAFGVGVCVGGKGGGVMAKDIPEFQYPSTPSGRRIFSFGSGSCPLPEYSMRWGRLLRPGGIDGEDRLASPQKGASRTLGGWAATLVFAPTYANNRAIRLRGSNLRKRPRELHTAARQTSLSAPQSQPCRQYVTRGSSNPHRRG